MLKIRTLCIGLLGILATHYASADDLLFKSYVHDSPMATYTSAQGYYDCSEQIGAKALCLDGVNFVEHEFTAVLLFSANKLIAVSLVGDYDQDLYAKTIGALAQSFTLVSLNDSKSQLDLLELVAKSNSKTDYTSIVSNYESLGLASGSLTYTFLDKSVHVKGSKGFVSALASAPDNSRLAEFTVASEGSNSSLMLRFSFPKLEANKVMSEVSKPVEKF